MLDAQLLAERYGKTLGVIVHAPAENLSPVPIGSFIETIFPDLRFEDQTPLMEDDPNLCMMLSTNAMFEINGAKNHWCPCWFVSQISSEFNMEVTILEARRIRTKLLELQEKLDALQLRDIPPKMDPAEKTMHFSAVSDVQQEMEKLPSC